MKLPLIASLTLAFVSPVNASVDPEVHKMCLNARDYQGCIKAQKTNSKQNINHSKRYKKAFSKCLKEMPLKYVWLAGRSKESIKRACQSLAKLDSETYRDRYFYFKGEKFNLQNAYENCLLSSVTNKKNKERRDLIPISEETCACNASAIENLSGKTRKDGKMETGSIYKACNIKSRYSSVYGGMRYFIKREDGKYLMDFGVREASLKQAKIRNQYGRYISFNGRSKNAYTGEYIPGERGYIDCDWGSSGSLYGDANSVAGGYSSSGGCYGQDSTPSITIPGGVDVGVFKYLLDCKDKTFDRKGDRISVSGAAMKGWQDVSSDSTATFVADVYCPLISTLPKQ